MDSCNSSICLECAIEFYQFMTESEDAIHECGFCGRSLAVKNDGRATRFSNIEELEAEQDESKGEIEFPNDDTSPDFNENDQSHHGEKDLETEGSQMSSMRSNQNILMKPYKTELEHMIIRDATEEE